MNALAPTTGPLAETLLAASRAPSMATTPAASSLTDDDRYEALRRRDATLDGQFVYAVRTTGVYCRPSCAARLAKRENVSFHVDGPAARRAGFRACQRCRPDEARADQRHADAVRRACRVIEEAEETPRLDDLAAAAGMSAFHFHRVFKKITGVTPKAFASARRAARVAASLRTSGSVTEAIYDAGFNASSRFYEEAQARLGMTPTAFRHGGAGESIQFAVGECSLGAILVAATERGVCAILLGDDPDRLARDLQDQFPRAELRGGDAAFERTVAEVVGFVDRPREAMGRGLALPLDIHGTAFQQRVWTALRAVPAGTTVSYAALAETIGAPKGARAVAGACAANPLAIAIPCHRVVRNDGGLSGYRWGVERKRALLEREAA